jgi:predicted metalloprotease with PDZ domain
MSIRRSCTAVGPFLLFVAGIFVHAAIVRAIEPVVFTVSFPSPSNHIAEVQAVYPTDGRPVIELIMPTWTPGFYRVENYAGKIQEFAARTTSGAQLPVEQPKTNRWRIKTRGQDSIEVAYRLLCDGHSVTTDWVGQNYAVLNGGATFPALAGNARRPYDVKLKLPGNWNGSMTALNPAPGAWPNQYRAEDYDALVDSPIVAGKLKTREIRVDGVQHVLVDAGEYDQWNSDQAAQQLEKVIRENRMFWGQLPFKRYVFLNIFRNGGGGLEHRNSTLLTSTPHATEATERWLQFVCHEYFHAFNVKRLRPVELDTFDYERPPRTAGLWVSEGLTTYYGELLPCRAGISAPTNFLAWLSSSIDRLQRSPGRLVQTLEQSSLEVWSTPTSGLARDTTTNTVSYYVKGPIVGFLLDAKIQHATHGRKSLDDLMRLAYARYSGKHGFTAEQFRDTAGQVAGVNLRDWFKKNISSTEELDYSEALDWFGLRFAPGENGPSWKLEVRPDATDAQKDHWKKLTGPSA